MIAEEFYLVARNIEFSIDNYLLENCPMLDGTTRRFLAQTRDMIASVADRAETEIRRP